MPLDPDMNAIINDLDGHLRTGEGAFSDAALNDDRDAYSPWYARLLTALTLLTVGDSILFATAAKEYDSDEARIFVFTDRLVIICTLNVSSGTAPAPTVVRRTAISSLRVSASMRADVPGSHARGWPGTLTFTLTYDGIAERLEFQAAGVNPYNLNEVAPARALLDALRGDLATAP